jgi:hypothetical protein
MDAIERRIANKRRELRSSLKPIFDEDSNNTAEMLIGALRREFGDPIKEDDRTHFLQALATLPRGSTARPKFLWASRYGRGGGLHFRAVFQEGPTEYISPKRFATQDEAETYGNQFLLIFQGEINGS